MRNQFKISSKPEPKKALTPKKSGDEAEKEQPKPTGPAPFLEGITHFPKGKLKPTTTVEKGLSGIPIANPPTSRFSSEDVTEFHDEPDVLKKKVFLSFFLFRLAHPQTILFIRWKSLRKSSKPQATQLYLQAQESPSVRE